MAARKKPMPRSVLISVLRLAIAACTMILARMMRQEIRIARMLVFLVETKKSWKALVQDRSA